MSYPETFDPDFIKKIYKKKEYNDLKPDRKKRQGVKFELEPHQIFAKRFISPITPYDRLLIFHSTGTGKSCLAVSIAENFAELNSKGQLFNDKDRVSPIRFKILVVGKEATENAFDSEMTGSCTNNKYRTSKSKDIPYHFTGYQKLGNDIDNKNITSLSNTVLIIDEVHNLTRESQVYNKLLEIVNNSTNLHIILLSATPMADKSSEIIKLINLLQHPNNQISSRGIFTDKTAEDLKGEDNVEGKGEKEKKGKEKKGEQRSSEDLIDNPTDNIDDSIEGTPDITIPTLEGLKVIQELMKGKVSYLRISQNTFPAREEIGVPVIKKDKNSIKVFPSEMSDFQYNGYKEANKQDINNTKGKIKGGIFQQSTYSSIIVYPNGSYGTKGFNNYISRDNRSGKTIGYKMKQIDFLTGKNLKNYSTKLYSMWQLIEESIEKKEGPIFIYTNYVEQGAEVIAAMLEANGMINFFVGENGKESKRLPKYAIWSGSQRLGSKDDHNLLKYIYSSPENRDGSLLKIIIGTPTISEGVTLKRTSQVHILDPTWNQSTMEQVIGRGIRNRSHGEMGSWDPLPPKGKDRPVVKVYRHMSTKKGHEIFDERMYKISFEKDKGIKQVERVLKEIAVDCPINYSRNVDAVDALFEDGSRNCDYTYCRYNCSKIPISDFNKIDNSKLDYSSYSTKLARSDIDYIKNIISENFKKHKVWKLQQFISIGEHERVDKIDTMQALHELVVNKELIHDKYGRTGYIIYRTGKNKSTDNDNNYKNITPINKKEYYIFNEIDKSERLSMYERNLPPLINNKKSLESMLKQSQFKSKIKDKSEGMIKTEPVFQSKISKEDFNRKVTLMENKLKKRNHTIYGNKINKKYERDGVLRVGGYQARFDKRTPSTGRVCKFFDIDDLQNIVKMIDPNATINFINLKKDDLCSIIEKILEKDNLIIDI